MDNKNVCRMAEILIKINFHLKHVDKVLLIAINESTQGI